MARQARKRSTSGIFHIMTRGINKMDMFHVDKDRFKYMDILREVREEHNISFYAYCLMTNHVHLLVDERDSAVSNLMKSIGIKYSMYFNKKNNRIGPVFQDRFRSEPIESENQMQICARYIHNNPVKAGIVSRPEDYMWSSFPVYLGYVEDNILDQGLLWGLYPDKAALKEFTCLANEDMFMDFDQEKSPDNREEEAFQLLEEVIQKKWGLKLSDIKYLKNPKQKMIIRELKIRTGLSYRKLAEVLEVSKDKIYRA